MQKKGDFTLCYKLRLEINGMPALLVEVQPDDVWRIVKAIQSDRTHYLIRAEKTSKYATTYTIRYIV